MKNSSAQDTYVTSGSATKSRKSSTHQSDENTKELDDVGVGDRIQSTDEGVEDGNACRQHYSRVHWQLQDNRKGGACNTGGSKGGASNTGGE